ncbi:hypothetical protein T12_15235 [Trichinella patagoniensis]|uniref:Uncharacterized protein n=1 Tax=Trichinella patagoniensis TaxID=990121 RepID=A0A0V0ZRD3_9BILA|nr:hypothetical protein T12_15235 [Trichinella patagoniensis]
MLIWFSAESNQSNSVQKVQYWAMWLKLFFICLGQRHRRERCRKRRSNHFWNALLTGEAVSAGKTCTKQAAPATRCNQ